MEDIAELDHDRFDRIGLPEAIFAPGKSEAHLVQLCNEMMQSGSGPVLVTRADPNQVKALKAYFPNSQIFPDPIVFPDGLKTVVMMRKVVSKGPKVVIVTGGTTDIDVAGEAEGTLFACGIESELIIDVGIAGLHRLLGKIDLISSFDVVLALAGMEGALPSILGGLVRTPILAVPTSRGYGASANGTTAMMSMLASCAPGIAVMGIDNGFGAACSAIRIVNAALSFSNRASS